MKITIVTLLACLFFSPVGVTVASTLSKRPNVLFIVVDDLRAETHSSHSLKTPALSQLARSGFSFDRAFCQMSVCGPSRVSVLSGARPDSTGVYENRTTLRASKLPDLTTLPQLFKQYGYQSLSVGKVFHHEELETGGDVSRRPGDDLPSWSETPWHHGTPYRQWFTEASERTLKAAQAEAGKSKRRIVRGPPYEAADQPDDAYPDGQIALKAIETLQRVQAAPFFLAVGFRRPHLPFSCPQKYWDLYPEAEIKLPTSAHAPFDAPQVALHDSYELRSYAGMPPEGPISHKDALALIRGYRASVSYVDAQIGRVLTELDRLGLTQNTIVVLWGDNGYHLGENGLWTKMTNYEAGTRVPLMIRAPGVTLPGTRSDALVELIDIYPTLVDLCALPRPAHLEGTSFKPVLTQPGRAWKQAVFSQFPRRAEGAPTHGRSLRTDRYRYTEWKAANDTVTRELYDLSLDPHNERNLANLSESQDLLIRLAAQLQAGWRAALPLNAP